MCSYGHEDSGYYHSGSEDEYRSGAAKRRRTRRWPHRCDLSCEVTYDPECPLWKPVAPIDRGTRDGVRHNEHDKNLAECIRHLPPLAKDELIDLIRDVVIACIRKLPEVREPLSDLMRDVLAADLPDAVDHLLQAKGRKKR